MSAPTVILGLGNPGARYETTRHNLGFRVVDRLATARGLRLGQEGELGRQAWWAEGAGVVLAKPRTYMNRSGRAALELCRRFGSPASALILVYDDADLELGRLRLRENGSAGGHRGVRSVLDALRTQDIPRVRLGVRGAARDESELELYVLEPFAADEQPIAAALVELAAEALSDAVAHGFPAAMQRFNGRRAAPAER